MDATAAAVERPARWTHLVLCHALALHDNHVRIRPAVRIIVAAHEEAAERDSHLVWAARNRVLLDDIAAEFSAVRRLLCAKCGGDGRNSNRLRHRGVCYSCQGDGYSAAGRRAAGLPRRVRVPLN